MDVDISTVLAGGPRRITSRTAPQGPPPLPPAPPTDLKSAIHTLASSSRSTPMTRAGTLDRTQDLLVQLGAKATALYAVVSSLKPPISVDGRTLDIYATNLEAGALPGPFKPGSIDFNAERHALVAELRDGDTKTALHRAGHLLDAVERVLSDSPFVSDLKPFDPKERLKAPKPAAPPAEAAPVPPTRHEVALRAYGSACYDANQNQASGEPYVVVDGDAVHLRLRLPQNSPVLHKFTRNLEPHGLKFDNGDEEGGTPEAS